MDDDPFVLLLAAVLGLGSLGVDWSAVADVAASAAGYALAVSVSIVGCVFVSILTQASPRRVAA